MESQIEKIANAEDSQEDILEVIKVENLRKHYNGLVALKGISFSVKRGEIFGFLGPNGAGKTTTINILTTLTPPTSGVAYINGYNVLTAPDKVRSSIGLVFQETTLDSHLTAEENLYLHALLYGMSRSDFLKRKREVLQLCELWSRRKYKVSQFSGGMRRRLEIARALIHFPQILFLDEPTIGLDPQTRNKIWDYIFATRKQKDTTIFLTTQYINEAESCDRVAIIDQGEIIALDTPSNLKKMIGGDIITIQTTDNDKAEKEIRQAFPQCNLKRRKKYIKIEVESGEQILAALVKAVTPTIVSLELRHPTLEDVFLELTGRQIREEVEETEEDIFPLNLHSLFSLFKQNHQK